MPLGSMVSQESEAGSPCPACRYQRWVLFATCFDRLLNEPETTWQVFRCPACGLGRTDPMPSSDELQRHYPESYLGDTPKTIQSFLTGELQRTRSWRNETDKVALLESFVCSGTILDVGCADAKFLWALDSQKWQRSGVDFAARTLQQVRRGISGLDLIEGDIFSSSLQPQSFDVITFWHVLEHLPRPGEVISRVRELLRPGGWIFISLPNFNSLQARLFHQHWYALDVPRHLYHFSPLSLELLLRKVGIQVSRHLFFSRRVNVHALKHSLIYWAEANFGSRLPYYLLKPLLLLFPLLEGRSGQYGTLTTIARRLPEKEEKTA